MPWIAQAAEPNAGAATKSAPPPASKTGKPVEPPKSGAENAVSIDAPPTGAGAAPKPKARPRKPPEQDKAVIAKMERLLASSGLDQAPSALHAWIQTHWSIHADLFAPLGDVLTRYVAAVNGAIMADEMRSVFLTNLTKTAGRADLAPVLKRYQGSGKFCPALYRACLFPRSEDEVRSAAERNREQPLPAQRIRLLGTLIELSGVAQFTRVVADFLVGSVVEPTFEFLMETSNLAAVNNKRKELRAELERSLRDHVLIWAIEFAAESSDAELERMARALLDPATRQFSTAAMNALSQATEGGSRTLKLSLPRIVREVGFRNTIFRPVGEIAPARP